MGIDPSTKTGVVVLGEEDGKIEILHSDEVTFAGKKSILRVQLMGQAIAALHEQWKPDLVVIEGYGFANKHTLVTLVEIGTSIRLALENCIADWAVATPNTLKKFVAGHGHTKKDAMMLATYKNWRFEGTDNECDAFGLAALGLYGFHPELEPRLSVPKRECFQEWRAEHLPLFLDKLGTNGLQ